MDVHANITLAAQRHRRNPDDLAERRACGFVVRKGPLIERICSRSIAALYLRRTVRLVAGLFHGDRPAPKFNRHVCDVVVGG